MSLGEGGAAYATPAPSPTAVKLSAPAMVVSATTFFRFIVQTPCSDALSDASRFRRSVNTQEVHRIGSPMVQRPGPGFVRPTMERVGAVGEAFGPHDLLGRFHKPVDELRHVVGAQGAWPPGSSPSYWDPCLSQLRLRFQPPLSGARVWRRMSPQRSNEERLARRAARTEWRGKSGFDQAPRRHVAGSGGRNERLRRHRRTSSRGGRSRAHRHRYRRPNDCRTNCHDDATNAGHDEGRPSSDSDSS
jgi:hypothetical protein